MTATKRILTYADVDACSLPRSTFDDRARNEGWPARPYPGVIVSPGPPLSPRERVEAAVRSVAGEAWVGGHAALFLHGIVDHPPTQTLLWVPVKHRGATSRTRLVRRTSLLTAKDTLVVEGLPTVQAAWALRDIAGATTGRSRLAQVADDLRDDGSDSGFEFRVFDQLVDEGLAPDTKQKAAVDATPTARRRHRLRRVPGRDQLRRPRLPRA